MHQWYVFVMSPMHTFKSDKSVLDSALGLNQPAVRVHVLISTAISITVVHAVIGY
jgi:hypothetical protein